MADVTTRARGPATEDPVLASARMYAALEVVALVITAAIHLVLALPGLLASLPDFTAPGTQIAGYAGLSVVLLFAAAMRALGKPVPFPNGALLVVLAIGVLTAVSLDTTDMFSTAHWSFLEIGWFGLVLLRGRAARVVGFIVAYVLMMAVVLVVSGLPGRTDTAQMMVVVAVVCTLQFAFVGVRQLVSDCAGQVLAAADHQVRVELDATATQRVRQDHDRRMSVLDATTIPLLAAVADGSADPADVTVRRRCAVEAARLRRFFAEADPADDPLVHELGAGIGVAERRGVAVALVVLGCPAPMPADLRRAAIDPCLAAVAVARSVARVTVVRTGNEVRLSVVTDEPAAELPTPRDPMIELTSVTDDTRLWVVVRVSRRQGAPPGERPATATAQRP